MNNRVYPFFDDNGNNHYWFDFEPWSAEQKAIVDDLKNGARPERISWSFYKATSFSMDYIHNATNTIKDLLNERKTEVNDGDYEMVFVWDIGEITTLTDRHLVHLVVSHRHINAHSLVEILCRIPENVQFCSEYDDKNVVNIEDVDEDESEEMKKRAPTYYALEKFYNEISDGMREDGPIVNYELIKRCHLTHRVLELYTGATRMQSLFHQRWKTARKCLEMVNKQSEKSHRKYANVVITEGGLGDGLTELMVSGCSKYIGIENVFSSSKGSKEMVFERIQKRYGEKCVLVYITSEPAKASIPEKLQIPIWEVKAKDSIEHLYNALQQNLFQ